MTLGYAWEKSYDAIKILAVIDEPLHQRLGDAYIHSLSRIVPQEDLPEGELREQYEELSTAVTAEEPTGGEGSVAATLSRLDSQELHDLATRFVEFCLRVIRLAGQTYPRDDEPP